jgi:hypothetical protein
MAASPMQIVPVWPPVAQISVDLFMLHATSGHAGLICMQLAATPVQFICNWLPVACNICMAASRTQHLHALAARTVQSRQSITLREQLFEIKNEDTI